MSPKTAVDHSLLHSVVNNAGLPTNLVDGAAGHIAAHALIHSIVGLGLPTVISPGDGGHNAASAALATWRAANSIEVPAGGDLRAIMAAGPAGSTYVLAGATYEIGATPLTPKSGDAVIGQPVTRGPLGQITATTKIHGTSASGVFRSPFNAAAFRLENVELWGSSTTGIHHFNAFKLTMRYCRIHDNLEAGLGARAGSLIEFSEIDHNGSAAYVNSSGGGMKFAFGTSILTVRNCYVHDNIGEGIWWDCDARGGTAEGNLVVGNTLSGIFIEISSGDGGGFFVQGNTVQGNNTSVAAIYAGILVVDSQNVTINNNILGGNGAGRGINLFQDSRSTLGHAGCNGGFPNLNITGSGNVLNGDSSDL